MREPGKVSMYVCGPTVYDLPHVGHGRAVLTYDVLRRVLEWTGIEVVHVSNITDIDDKIIQRANELGEDPAALARRYEDEWFSAMDRLDVLRPTASPRATDYVEGMVDLIERFLKEGSAYETKDSVLLSVDSVPDYGLLAHQDLAMLRTTERVGDDAFEDKRNPLDFVLWKKAKPGEPTWPAPWGAGRPGWNTECVVMSLDLLGEGFDLHAGGLDLKFPHHENERAQAVAMGKEFAMHWMHHAFIVADDGEKMSKSLGNFTSLTDLLDRVDPRAYRMLLLQAHYRSPVQVSPVTIAAAEASLAGLDALARRAGGAGLDTQAMSASAAALAEFRALLEDDLKTAQALSKVFEWVRLANIALDDGERLEAGRLVSRVLAATSAVGLVLHDGTSDLDPVAEALAKAREAARVARNWSEADRLRDELAALGWRVEDAKTGSLLVRI